MSRPTDRQFAAAIVWLRTREGEDAVCCKTVAAWIERENRDRSLKQAARKAGISIVRARRMLAKATAEKIEAEIPVKCTR